MKTFRMRVEDVRRRWYHIDADGKTLGKIAVKAANRLGLKFAGVDILRSSKGPLLLEVNSSPGLEGIEKTTGADIAGQVLDSIEHRTFRVPPRLKKAA